MAGKSNRKQQIPSKTTVNLAGREPLFKLTGGTMATVLVIILLTGAFARFAVIGRLARVSDARAELAVRTAELAGLEASNAENQSVTEEYNRYFYKGFSEEELSSVDRMEALNLLERELMGAAQVSSIQLTGNTMSVTLSGVTLQQLSEMMRSLKEHPIVQDVSVYTAGTERGQETGEKATAASMTIVLAQPEKGGDGA